MTLAGTFRIAHRNGLPPQRKESSMLVLDRRIREEILIIDNQSGEEIVVAPTGFRRNQIKIGIEASKTRYTILRREVQERERAAALT